MTEGFGPDMGTKSLKETSVKVCRELCLGVPGIWLLLSSASSGGASSILTPSSVPKRSLGALACSAPTSSPNEGSDGCWSMASSAEGEIGSSGGLGVRRPPSICSARGVHRTRADPGTEEGAELPVALLRGTSRGGSLAGGVVSVKGRMVEVHGGLEEALPTRLGGAVAGAPPCEVDDCESTPAPRLTVTLTLTLALLPKGDGLVTESVATAIPFSAFPAEETGVDKRGSLPGSLSALACLSSLEDSEAELGVGVAPSKPCLCSLALVSSEAELGEMLLTPSPLVSAVLVELALALALILVPELAALLGVRMPLPPRLFRSREVGLRLGGGEAHLPKSTRRRISRALSCRAMWRSIARVSLGLAGRVGTLCPVGLLAALGASREVANRSFGR